MGNGSVMTLPMPGPTNILQSRRYLRVPLRLLAFVRLPSVYSIMIPEDSLYRPFAFGFQSSTGER
eukprot:scaffold2077_cov119-Cylindrotheca_fusiformis.AAC.12